MSVFSDNLRRYREAAGYSQAKDFAAALGVKYSTYIGYEAQGREPKYDILCKIAAALHVSTDELLGHTQPGEAIAALERLGFQCIPAGNDDLYYVKGYGLPEDGPAVTTSDIEAAYEIAQTSTKTTRNAILINKIESSILFSQYVINNGLK